MPVAVSSREGWSGRAGIMNLRLATAEEAYGGRERDVSQGAGGRASTGRDKGEGRSVVAGKENRGFAQAGRDGRE